MVPVTKHYRYIYGKTILKKLAKNKNFRKVRHHCHYTGKYRGATHSICNLKFNVSYEIHVVFLAVQTTIIILL